MDCACSAQLETAPEFRARQAQRVAQNPQQRHLRRDVDALSFPVKGKLNGWHWNPPRESRKYNNFGDRHRILYPKDDISRIDWWNLKRGNGTQKAQRGHKMHKTRSRLLVSFLAFLCLLAILPRSCWAKR